MNIYEEVSLFYWDYRGEKCIVGRSAEGRNLYAMFTGSRKTPVCVSQYAIHAREWVTALLALEHLRYGVGKGGAWILPLMNPDGALLSERGLSSVSSARRGFLMEINGNEDFSLWKANAEGVDLNVNFPARWGMGRGNISYPAPHGYIGKEPLSAPESRALAEFTELVVPDYSVSWHTKGEEIYWKFHEPHRRAVQSKRLAKIISRETGYPIKSTPFSSGGYKDWCIQALKIPAFTVEVGMDSRTHPIGREALSEISGKNLRVLSRLNEEF